MPSLKRFFELAPHYLRRFGAVRGTDVLARTIVAKIAPAGWSIPVRVPGLAMPLALRARTSDVKVFHQVFVDREHDVKDLVGDATIIVDAGANVGFSSVFFATAFPRARIIAIEPEAGNYAQLVRNTAAYPNVTAIHAALWNKRGHVRIANPDSEQWAFRVAADGTSAGGVSIPALGVADVMEEFRLPRVDILKIDIEGAEIEVFESSCDAWMPRVRNIMIELHDYLKVGCEAAVYRAADRARLTRAKRGEFVVLSRPAASG